jgi:hypothetical protein
LAPAKFAPAKPEKEAEKFVSVASAKFASEKFAKPIDAEVRLAL